ncbi:MAG: helix-turn-helix transcriptional regulator [Lentisphaeria bacterium]|nr:helix-turn-helix transcriptional regulator [Lentisphaeria bacterium]
MNLLELSQTIRSIRKKQGVTVEYLAKKSGFSKGFISQVENFRITPSLKALIRIAEALGVSVENLFNGQQSPGKPYSFGKLTDGTVLDRDAGEMHGIHYSALAYSQIGRKMDPFIIEYTPGSPRDFLFHETEEFFVLLEGQLDYYIYDDTNCRRLGPGDTVYMMANIPHRVSLPENCTSAKALVVYSDETEM